MRRALASAPANTASTPVRRADELVVARERISPTAVAAQSLGSMESRTFDRFREGWFRVIASTTTSNVGARSSTDGISATRPVTSATTSSATAAVAFSQIVTNLSAEARRLSRRSSPGTGSMVLYQSPIRTSISDLP